MSDDEIASACGERSLFVLRKQNPAARKLFDNWHNFGQPLVRLTLVIAAGRLVLAVRTGCPVHLRERGPE